MIRHNRLIQISIRKSGRCLKMENKGSNSDKIKDFAESIPIK